MKHHPRLSSIAALFAAQLAFTGASAQNAPLRAPPGGFDRPLSDSPRQGNPGASPKLTAVEFKTLLGRWADFDADKNLRLDKTEVPELFAAQFDQADANHDGALDEKERAGVAALTIAKPASTPATPAPPTQGRPPRGPGPMGDPLRRAVFGTPLPGAPLVPQSVR